jgi:hypothetical protein
MNTSDEWKKTVRLNKLLGIWAAEKLGMQGGDADAYSDGLALAALDPERSDVLSKIRKDFDAAGVVQSDASSGCKLGSKCRQRKKALPTA